MRKLLPYCALGLTLLSTSPYGSLFGNSPELSDSSQDVYFSQASQDEFVTALLYGIANKQDQGYYLEIGAEDPVRINNTYFLEKNKQWTGVSIDINPQWKDDWALHRTNPLLIENAITCDYSAALESFPAVIDYLSLDIDGYYDAVLNQLPLQDYTFKVITIEHDFYRYGDFHRKMQRDILNSHGYYLLCADVTHPACGSFEDWWIHPSAFDSTALAELLDIDLYNKDHQEIIRLLKKIQ